MAAKQAMKENLQYTSKYGHLRRSQDICYVRMTDIEIFLTIYGHSDNLLNNKMDYMHVCFSEITVQLCRTLWGRILTGDARDILNISFLYP